MVISIIGGSGSGKDTQAKFVAEKYNLPHLSMGNILREAERAGNPLGIEAVKILNEGQWVPDAITSKLFMEHVNANAKEGFVITGYPRFIEQAHTFDGILAELGLKLTCVVHMHAPDEILLQRLHKQAVETANSSDQRGDTSDEAIQRRLKSYHDTINPVLAKYREEGILIDIDATPAIDVVTSQIIAAIDARVKNA